MKIFRCSFSVLDPWSRGDYDEAVRRFYKTDQTVTPQMEMGRLKHEEWRTETTKTGCFPKDFGGARLKNPQCELKMECLLDGWIQFVGIIDLLENQTITDYKTGVASSLTYVRTMQLPCYQVLAKENGIATNQAVIRHFNQYTTKVTSSYKYLTPETEEAGREWITTFASEMASSLQETGQL